jgi:uncharacterized protein YaiI (UPF0178 family)
MCFVKKVIVLNPDGAEFTAANIDSMLSVRHTARKLALLVAA